MRYHTTILLGMFFCIPLPAYAAPSPLTFLADPEKAYYEKVFNYSMETVTPDDKYDWSSYSGKGMITIGLAFTSPSGAICRNFSETFIVHGQSGMDKGVGCKRRGQEGWCKLDLGKEAKTCSFEDTSRMFGGMNLTVPTTISAPSVISVPSAGPAITPNVSVNTNVDTKVNTNVDKKDLTVKNYSDTVTGSVGKGAGQAAGGAVSWFTSTFLR